MRSDIQLALACRFLPGTVLLATLLAPPIFAQTPVPAPESKAAATEAPAADPAATPWYENVKISGSIFGDGYWVTSHHDPAIEDQNGFWLRRLYLTFDYAIAEHWTARLRFEGNSPGDFKTNATIQPFVKDAYLAWKGKQVDLLMGISPSPTWDFIEGFWGYRAVEKTPLDLYRMGSSREFGVAARGKLADGRVFYHATFGNGSTASETNEGKKAALAVGWKPTDAFIVELYADGEDRPGETDRTTYQAFVGWKGEKSRYGFQYSSQERQVPAGPDQTLAIGSTFAVWNLCPKMSLIARYDRSFDGNPEADKIPYFVIAKDAEFDLALLGFDYRIAGKISLIPNVESVMYRETAGNPAPDDDVIAKVTLYFQF